MMGRKGVKKGKVSELEKKRERKGEERGCSIHQNVTIQQSVFLLVKITL
jgi:hypothetical protein